MLVTYLEQATCVTQNQNRIWKRQKSVHNLHLQATVHTQRTADQQQFYQLIKCPPHSKL